ncbi:MAG: hypothetical protein WCR19_05420 [Acholeplasmataceae bacterium]
MEVKFGNLYYFIYLIILAVFMVLINIYFGKVDAKKRYKILIIISFSSLLLHFSKMFFYPYNQDISYLRKISFENICAVSTLIFPFILLSKNKYLLDYVMVMGLVSGILSIFLPLEAYSNEETFKAAFSFDVMRFYYAHFIILLTGVLLYRFRLHELSKKRIFYLPITFLSILCVIVINELLLIRIGFVEYSLDLLFDVNYRNSSLIFGIPDNLNSFRYILTIFVPKFLKDPYIPIIWLVIPSYIYLPLMYESIRYLNHKNILIFKEKRND